MGVGWYTEGMAGVSGTLILEGWGKDRQTEDVRRFADILHNVWDKVSAGSWSLETPMNVVDARLSGWEAGRKWEP